MSIRTKQRARTGAAKKGRKRRRGGATEPQPVTAQQLRDLPIDFSAIDRDSEALASRATLLELSEVLTMNDALSDTSPIFLLTFGDECACHVELSEGILNYLTVGEPFIHRAFGTEPNANARHSDVSHKKAYASTTTISIGV